MDYTICLHVETSVLVADQSEAFLFAVRRRLNREDVFAN